ncbi:signal peptidase I [Tepidamorphus sp. 3E244]|uniref:signal peptidase I n=1 Tax=Tepidamorphus sp. 3E244 TaxID=3385498 RepID=UPI0038FBF1A1
MSVSKRVQSSEAGGIGETIRIVIHALLIALVIRTFLFQPFSIPSGSMKSTLMIGDYLFVSKYSYGYSKYSFPFGIGPFDGRIMAGDPKRGDVAVFKLPKDNSTDYIKRVIGLPGETIQVKSGIVHINGEPVTRERVGDYTEDDGRGGDVTVPRYRETLPNGKTYTVLDLVDNGYGDNTPEYVVPEGHYFMMGDNRDNSTDSRFLNMVGYVPYENFVGRAEVIFLSLEEGSSFWQFWKWPYSIRWGRLFSGVE